MSSAWTRTIKPTITCNSSHDAIIYDDDAAWNVISFLVVCAACTVEC